MWKLGKWVRIIQNKIEGFKIFNCHMCIGRVIRWQTLWPRWRLRWQDDMEGVNTMVELVCVKAD